ncbi:MAG: GDSL-type esterase/lipase family protein [Candidatus Sumerlaeota bacterium]
MILISAISILGMVSLGMAAEEADTSDPIRILPLGDSITQGGKKDREEYTYRWPLFKMLKDEGYNFDFIGSMDKGLHKDAEWPEHKGEKFDMDHEGHYGWKTDKVRENLAEWMKSYPAPPDIVLIHLGTNDQKAGDYENKIAKPLKQIIEMLREKNPEVVVLVGHLNFTGGKAVEIREIVQKMIDETTTEKSPVIAVHHYEGFNANPQHPETDTFDWAHPNPSGQEKMAKKWFEAMKPYLDKMSGE